MSRWKLFIPLLIFVVLAGFFLKGLKLNPDAMPSALIDQPVPDFSLPTLQNLELAVGKEALPQEVFLLNVWATWCSACRAEHPTLMAIAAQQGMPVVGINYKDDYKAAQQWLVDFGNPYRFNLYDVEGRLGLDLGVFGAPETYLVDARGVIRYKHVGVVDTQVWEQTLKPLVMRFRAEAGKVQAEANPS